MGAACRPYSTRASASRSQVAVADEVFSPCRCLALRWRLLAPRSAPRPGHRVAATIAAVRMPLARPVPALHILGKRASPSPALFGAELGFDGRGLSSFEKSPGTLVLDSPMIGGLESDAASAPECATDYLSRPAFDRLTREESSRENAVDAEVAVPWRRGWQPYAPRRVAHPGEDGGSEPRMPPLHNRTRPR